MWLYLTTNLIIAFSYLMIAVFLLFFNFCKNRKTSISRLSLFFIATIILSAITRCVEAFNYTNHYEPYILLVYIINALSATGTMSYFIITGATFFNNVEEKPIIEEKVIPAGTNINSELLTRLKVINKKIENINVK